MPRQSMRNIDENPQFLNMTVTESAANTFTQASVSCPTVQSLGNEKALVMEILKIFIASDNSEFVNATTTILDTQITKQSKTAMVGLNDPNVFWRDIERMVCVDTAATDATLLVHIRSQLKEIDFRDGAGNGILFGGKELYIAVKGTNQTGVKTFTAKILYRLKEVKASELIGIIQE